MPHYTSTDQDAFVERIIFDFISQVGQRLEHSDMSQGQLAEKLGVSDSDVSQVLNLTRTNLNLKTMVRYARALGMKLAVVAYDDDDPNNDKGPVGPEIFSSCWEKIGRPRDIWAVRDATSSNRCFHSIQNWPTGWTNATTPSIWERIDTSKVSHTILQNTSPEEGNTNARGQELSVQLY